MTPAGPRVRPARPRRLVAALVVCAAAGLAGCGGSSAAERPAPATGSSPVTAPSSAAPDEPAPTAPVGTPAASERVRFVPATVVLPGGASAPVRPAATVHGTLAVPEEVAHVGWWDGSAYAGDPFGNTVIAGHVDSATEGLGFFSRLLGLRPGETVTLRGDGHHLAYRITSLRTVRKDALATGSSAFDQDGDPHLVLITCGGAYHRDRGGYDSNVVVTAVPVGLAR